MADRAPAPQGETGATCPHVAAGRRVRSKHEVAAPKGSPSPSSGPGSYLEPRAERSGTGAGVGGCWALGPHQVRFPVEQVLGGMPCPPWGRPARGVSGLSPGLLERIICRIMRDMVSPARLRVLGRHQPSRSVHELLPRHCGVNDSLQPRCRRQRLGWVSAQRLWGESLLKGPGCGSLLKVLGVSSAQRVGESLLKGPGCGSLLKVLGGGVSAQRSVGGGGSLLTGASKRLQQSWGAL